MSETTFEKISRKTGMKPKECKCSLCKSQCQQPGWGTPEDMFKIIKAGFGKRLGRTVINGVQIVLPQKDSGYCTFYKDGLCELHDLGLKPTVCKLSHHSTEINKFNPKKSIAAFVFKEWKLTKEEMATLANKYLIDVK